MNDEEGVRYEYCNGRAGGKLKKPQPHGEKFCGRKKRQEKTIRKKKDDGICRRERKSI